MNISRTLTRCFIILLSAFGALRMNGQGFNKNYPAPLGDCKDVTQSLDGGYFMTGVFQDGDVQKVNGAGDVSWTLANALSGGSGIAISTAPDGGFVVLGQNYPGSNGLKSILVKISAFSIKEWELVIDNNLLPNGLKDVVSTSDGGFLLAGDTRDNQLKQNIWLVKVDANGSLAWNKSIGYDALDEQVAQLIALADGNFMIYGSVLENTNDPNFFLAKTDPDGNLIWQKKYNKPGFQIPYDLLQSTDGGMVLLGDTYQNDPLKVTLLKTDGDGNELWYNKLDLASLYPDFALQHIVQSFARDNADNLYIPIHVDIDLVNGTELLLLKLDAEANLTDYFSFGNNYFARKIINIGDSYLGITGGDELNRSFLIKTDLEGEIYSNKINGNIFDDQNDNCLLDGGETGLQNFIVEARNTQNVSFFKKTAADGSFTIRVNEGDYQIIVHPPSGRPDFWSPCDTPTVSIVGTNQTVSVPDNGVRTLVECPFLEVDLATNLLRRCSTAVYSINYCNNGNLPAINASVQLTVDPSLSYQSSTIPLTTQNGNVLTFDIADVLSGDCQSFKVNLLVSCDAELGQTICAEAHIFPDSSCLPDNLSWDGSQLEVTGECNGDITFRIHNIGLGDMTQPSEYVIIEDHIMYRGAIKLDADADTVFTFLNPPPHAYYMRADQTPGAPVYGNPTAVVQDCESSSPFSLAMQLPLDEASPFISIYCDNIVGSYDPNDKRGFPLGWKDEHFIEPGQEIEYMIRFQNTGNDTAFTVVIRDSITAFLDLASVIAGPSSHPYTWDINDGRVLTFRFNNIHLPDSNVNEAASHGYVMFRIKQAKDLPLGTIIENNANIYFDVNDPVQTNTYFHTLGEDLITTVTHEQKPDGLRLEVFPNPFSLETLFRLNDVSPNSQIRLALYNLTGNLVREETFSGSEYRFHSNGLLPGIYLFRMEDKGGKTVTGKVTVQR